MQAGALFRHSQWMCSRCTRWASASRFFHRFIWCSWAGNSSDSEPSGTEGEWVSVVVYLVGGEDIREHLLGLLCARYMGFVKGSEEGLGGAC